MPSRQPWTAAGPRGLLTQSKRPSSIVWIPRWECEQRVNAKNRRKIVMPVQQSEERFFVAESILSVAEALLGMTFACAVILKDRCVKSLSEPFGRTHECLDSKETFRSARLIEP